MEDLHPSWPRRRKAQASTTIAARSVYEDVFGGPPMHPANFPLKFEDYSEIFSAAASACTIPVLDLPPACEDFDATDGGYGPCDRRRGINYLEIFGGFGGSDFVLSYEELYVKPKGSAITSSDARTSSDVFKLQRNEALVHPLKDYAEIHAAKFETEQSSVPKHFDDASLKQFGISYHRSQGIKDSMSESSSTAAIDDSREFASVDAINPIPEVKKKALNEGTTNILGTQNCIVDEGQQSEAPPKSSSGVKNTVINCKSDQTPLESDCVSLLHHPADKKHHSHSADCHSTSSGDMSSSSTLSYLRLSEISLQTMPLQGPPPSRSPPKLFRKPEHSKVMHMESSYDVEEKTLLKPKVNYQLHSNSGEIDVHAVSESVKGNSCFSGEIDPCSAAAASVAAVKEAMEQAQARLKSAKDAMDRKRDKRHRKASLDKTMTDKKDRPTYDVELKSSCKVRADDKMLKLNNLIDECAFLEKQEVRSAGKASLNHEEMKTQCPSSRMGQQYQSQDDELKSFHMNTLEVSGKWEADSIHHGHIRNGGLLGMVNDIYMQGNEKRGTEVMYPCHKKEINCEEEQALKDDHNLSESIFDFENYNNITFGSMHCKEDKNVADAIMEDVLLKNNAGKLGVVYGHHQLNDNQKSINTSQDDTTINKVEMPSSVVYPCHINHNEKRSDASNLDVKLGVWNSYCEGREFEAPEMVPGYVEDKMESFLSHVNCDLNGSIKEVNVANGSFANNMFDSTQTKELPRETEPYNYYENKVIYDKHQNCSEVNGYKIEESENVAVKENEGDGIKTNTEVHILMENELEQEAIEEDKGLEKFKVQGKLIDAKIDQTMYSTKGTCLESCNEKETQEGQTESLSNEKRLYGDCRTEGQQNYESLPLGVGYSARNQIESIIEVNVDSKLGDYRIRSNSAAEVCHCITFEESTPEVVLSRQESNLQATESQPAKASNADMDENCIHSLTEEVENKKNMDIEREMFEDEKMKLEEKDRDKEREKDRIATERTNYESRQRAFAETQERAERNAVERAAAEARQRALAEARVKAEKAAEETRLRSERAAVERATEEARQRAIKKALAEKSAAEERERAAQIGSTYMAKMRKDNVAVPFKASHKVPQNIESLDADFSTNGQRYSDYCNDGVIESKLRCKARQEREQRIAERSAKALSEKNMRDIIAQREQAERERLAESLDAEVRRWVTGKDGNLRALLSTLHYILGPDSGWRPIPLTDVITPTAVKKVYRKATLCVHPDKLQQRGATIQQKYICEKVFDLLKEAWNKFNPEEWYQK